jgi:drug/metabolite transporter (DMT)-like permease
VNSSAELKPYLVLLAGMLGSASSVFFIKFSGLAPASLAAARLLLSALLISPFAALAIRGRGRPFGWDDVRVTLPAAGLLAIHYTTWFVGVRETAAVLSTLIVNLIPVLMPFLVWFLLRERITRGELLGSIVSLAGVAWLALGKQDERVTTPRGIAFCCVSIAFCAGYLAMGRRFGRGRSIVVYIVPLYAIAGTLCAIYALAVREPLPPINLREATIVLCAVIFPTVIGHTATNYAMVHLPSQVVSMSNPLQAALIAVAAIPILGEYPTPSLIIPALLVVAGVVIVVRFAPRRVQKEIERAATEPPGT